MINLLKKQLCRLCGTDSRKAAIGNTELENGKERGWYKSKSRQEKLAIVQNSNLGIRPLLNEGEKEAFAAINTFIRTFRPDHYLRFSPQVSMGEYFADHHPSGKVKTGTDAYWAIQHLRSDFCIYDADWNTLVAIEYNGWGHYPREGSESEFHKATGNELIKKAACERAGIIFHTVPPHCFGKDAVLAQLNENLKPLLAAKLQARMSQPATV